MAEAPEALLSRGADIVVFDLATIRDQSTVPEPLKRSLGMQHVLVLGVPVVRDGEILKNRFPGEPVRAPVSRRAADSRP